jgi:hypothetical protein
VRVCGPGAGFVVDKALGLILTNRHVLRPGPVVAEAAGAGHSSTSHLNLSRGFHSFTSHLNLS